MITTRTLAVATLSLVLGAAPLYAQRASDTPQQATDVPGQDAKETQKNQESPTADKPATAPATRPPATNNDSPFDYRPSEKISEDLSVSFPVDI
jgi:hypothetical protein